MHPAHVRGAPRRRVRRLPPSRDGPPLQRALQPARRGAAVHRPHLHAAHPRVLRGPDRVRPCRARSHDRRSRGDVAAARRVASTHASRRGTGRAPLLGQSGARRGSANTVCAAPHEASDPECGDEEGQPDEHHDPDREPPPALADAFPERVAHRQSLQQPGVALARFEVDHPPAAARVDADQRGTPALHHEPERRHLVRRSARPCKSAISTWPELPPKPRPSAKCSRAAITLPGTRKQK